MGGCNPQNDRIEQLYHEIYDKLYRYAKNALSDPSIAEEATQDVFCIACAKSDELLQSNNPQGWLMKTLKYVIQNIKREQAKTRRLAILSLNSDESDLLATYDEEDVDILYGDLAPREDFQIFKLIACIYRAELATCTGKTCHLAGEFPPPRRRGLPVQKRDHIL